ncbi:MAG: hypothetical protein ACK5H0_08880 [Bacteroidota bacterium]
MAHKRKGQLTPVAKRAKHLRPFGKKQAAKRERKAGKNATTEPVGKKLTIGTIYGSRSA